jgi:Zn-dependent metalloprotease
MTCTCHIVPKFVLDRLAHDKTLSDEIRRASFESSLISDAFRALREQQGKLSATLRGVGAQLTDLAASPEITVFDSKHTQSLPGVPVHSPGSSKDTASKQAFGETTKVAEFYGEIFRRNSVDGAGMTLVSSVHYGKKYNNAFWNGSQMVYGDGDGQIFTDFTAGNDVIGHELTHGVTQHSLQLGYSDDAGGLNESVSDCFGSMFRQWQAGQTSVQADWLIGSGIMGPVAKERGYTCLRDMANPANTKALAPQPTNYSQVTPGMDPHFSSGPPNLAFCLACKAVPGHSWETIGQIWYHVLTASGPHPTMRMKDFANRTRQAATQLFHGQAAVLTAVDTAWKSVGL